MWSIPGKQLINGCKKIIEQFYRFFSLLKIKKSVAIFVHKLGLAIIKNYVNKIAGKIIAFEATQCNIIHYATN